MPDPNDHCINCYYYRPKEPTKGLCCKHAPAVAVAADKPILKVAVVAWPMVDGSDWCGEYSRASGQAISQ